MLDSLSDTATALTRAMGLRRRLPPFEIRDGKGRWGTATKGIHPRMVRVERLVRETDDAATLHLSTLDGSELDFQPGQFLTVIVEVDGTTHRRCYSFSSAPGDPAAITSKRIPGGIVSGFLNEQLREGDTLRVLGPSGEFTIDPEPDASRRFVFVAGGSGITPVISLAESLLAAEPGTSIDLLYGNRSWRDVIFLERLDRMRDRHERFRVQHVLELDGGERRSAAQGLLSGDVALGLVDDPAGVEGFYLCGPEPMREGVTSALLAAGVSPEKIHAERFVIADKKPVEVPGLPGEIVFLESGLTVSVPPGQTILQAGLASGVPLDFSCTMGGCGACKVRKVDGSVVMEEPNCLGIEEANAGWFLACCAYADGTVTVDR